MAKVRKSSPVRRAAIRPAPAIGKNAPASSSRGLEIIRIAALALLCACIWCTVYNRWNAANWSVPLEYGLNPAAADVKSDLAAFKAAEDGHFWPIVFHNEPDLGAPYDGNWNDYAVTEDFLIFGTGMLAKIIGLFPAANSLILFGQVLAAVAFYYAARRLKCDWRWSFGAALLFALAPFAFAHSLHHFVITYYWHIPLCLLVCFWLANGPGLRLGTRDYRIAAGIAIVTGLQNVYYTNIFIQLAGVALIIQWVRHGWRAALPALSIGCMAFGSFMVMNLDTIGFALLQGPNTGSTVRNYAWLELYGLKLVDCFVPFPTHRIPFLAALGQRFYSSTVLPAETPPACYFGLAGIAAFLWLAAGTVRNAISRPARKIPLEAVFALWTLLYGTVGGVNAMVGVLNFQMFRSTTRYCIVLLCLALLFAIRRLSLLSRRWPSPWPMLAPTAIAIAALWEFLPPATAQLEIDETAGAIKSDQQFAEAMQDKLPAHGMVFQLPVMDFPESPAAGIAAYDHFRPFFFTNGLRYSFGSSKGRPRESWQNVITGLTPAAQIATLEQYGFSGIYVNRAGYPDRGEGLLAQYKAAGRPEVIESLGHDLFCVVLHPSATPTLPPPGPFFASGWVGEQVEPNGQRHRIARGQEAVLILVNSTASPTDRYARFYLASAGPRVVTMQGAGVQQNWRVDGNHPVAVRNLRLTLAPGENRILFSTDAPATAQAIGPVTFDVVSLDLSDQPFPE